MHEENVMDNIRSAFERLGMTLNELGEGLGYDWSNCQEASVIPVVSHVRPQNLDGDCRRSDVGSENKQVNKAIGLTFA
jgi:hypothetical protein